MQVTKHASEGIHPGFEILTRKSKTGLSLTVTHGPLKSSLRPRFSDPPPILFVLSTVGLWTHTTGNLQNPVQ